MVKAINEAPNGYKRPNYVKARTMLLEREKEIFLEFLHVLQMSGWIVGIHSITWVDKC